MCSAHLQAPTPSASLLEEKSSTLQSLHPSWAPPRSLSFGEQVWKLLWGKNSPIPKILLCISNETKKVRESFCKLFHVVPVLMILLKILCFFSSQFSPHYSHGLFSQKICYGFFKSSAKIKGCDLKQSFSKKFYGEVIKRENQSRQKSPCLLVQQEICWHGFLTFTF